MRMKVTTPTLCLPGQREYSESQPRCAGNHYDFRMWCKGKEKETQAPEGDQEELSGIGRMPSNPPCRWWYRQASNCGRECRCYLWRCVRCIICGVRFLCKFGRGSRATEDLVAPIADDLSADQSSVSSCLHITVG